MKNLNILFLISFLMIGFATACGGGDGKGGTSIEGTWQLHSVAGEELTESEKSAMIEFKSDGTMIQTRGDRTKEGTWEMKEADGKKMLITTFEGKPSEAEVKVLDGTTLTFVERDTEVTLKRK